MHEGNHFARQFPGDFRRARGDDFPFAIRVRVIDPVIQAAPLQRIVNFAGAVGGENDDGTRVVGRAHRAELGDGDLKIRQHFQQERFKRFIGAIEFIDQQHRRGAGNRQVQRLQQRARGKEFAAVNGLRQIARFGALAAARVGQTDRHHLLCGIPFVGGTGKIETFVALQANQRAFKHGRENLRDVGFADAGFAFEK